MTKRTKLLSLVVAAALCLVAGFAMMFNSTAKADVVVPDAPTAGETRLDLDWSTTGQALAFAQDTGTDSDWMVWDFYIPAGVTNDASTVNAAVTTAYAFNGANLSDAADTSVGVAIDVSTLFDNAGSVAKRVRVAFDLVNGKVYTSDGAAAFVEAASYTNWSYVSGASSKYTYLHLGSPSTKQLVDVKVYTEDGAFTGWRSGNPGNTNNGGWAATKNELPAIPATAVKPAVDGQDYVADSSLDFRNATATTADWIIFEYSISSANTATAPQNGFCATLSNDGTYSAATTADSATKSVELFAFGSTPAISTFVNAIFVADTDTTVKLAVNTKTGLLAVQNKGSWSAWSGVFAASGLSGTDRYFGVTTNGSKLYGVINDLVCYDSNGTDLGVVTTKMIANVAPDLPATAVKPAVDNVYYANDSLKIQTTNPTTARYIIMEYTLKGGIGVTNGGNAPQNGIITTLSNDGSLTHISTAGSASSMMFGFGTNPVVQKAYEWFISAEDANCKFVIDTETGTVYYSNKANIWSSYGIYTGASALTGEDRYFGITTNAGAGGSITGTIEDLVIYDSEGNDLGVTTNLISSGTIAADMYELGVGAFPRWQGHVSYVRADGSAAADKAIGSIAVKKNGTDNATLTFVSGGGSLQLLNFADNGYEGFAGVYDWYLVEEGTIFGSVALSEDLYIAFNESSMAIFKTDKEFAIAYTGADAGSNPTAYSFKDTDDTALTAPVADDGLVFAGWYLGTDKVETVADIAELAIFGDVTLTAKFVTEVTLKTPFTFGAQGGNLNRYLGNAEELLLTDGTTDYPAIFLIGNITVLDAELNEIVVEVKYTEVEENKYQVIDATEFGVDAIGDVAKAVYTLPVGTVLGDYILTEAIVMLADGANGATLYPAGYTFDITYEDLRGATNGNADSYGLTGSVTLSNITKEGLEFVGWTVNGTPVTEISFPEFAGDVTVTANWKEARIVSYNAEIFADATITINVYAVINGYDNISAPGFEFAYDQDLGLYVFTANYRMLPAQVPFNILSGLNLLDSANIDVAAYLGRQVAGSVLTAEEKAVVADYLAYNAALMAMMPEGPEYVAPAGATTAPAYASQAYGEIGMRDSANYWDFSDGIVFKTNATESVQVELNGEKGTFEVVNGEVDITEELMGEGLPLHLLGAKLTLKVFKGEAQIGNTAVVNIAALAAPTCESEEDALYLARAYAFYTSFAAYLAD